MNLVERRKIANGLKRDLKDFEKFLASNKYICGILAGEILNCIRSSYGDNNRYMELLMSVKEGKNLNEFVDLLAIEDIIALNSNSYLFYAKCWPFDLGGSIPMVLSDNQLVLFDGQDKVVIKLQGLVVKVVQGKLSLIDKDEDFDNADEDYLKSIMDW